MPLSEESVKNAMCLSKVRHRDFLSAAKHLSNRTDGGGKHKKLKVKIHAYPCPYCEGWHIGHGERRR